MPTISSRNAPTDQKCVVCIYYGSDPNVTSQGWCMRFPPTPVYSFIYTTPTNLNPTMWPNVAADDWCGEFKAPPAPVGAPVITSISPTTVISTGSQTISVRGNNFTAQSKIIFGGNEQQTTVRDLTWLQATVISPGIGIYEVLVRDAAGDSNVMQFEFK